MAKTIWQKTEDMNKKKVDHLGNKFPKNEVTPNKEYTKPCLALRETNL